MITLRHAEVRICLPGDISGGLVQTHFPDGLFSDARRDANDVTKQDAFDLGYAPTEAGVWRSMVEHELTHSILSELAWSRPSRVLRHEAGGERTAYDIRIYEESLVLAIQRYMHTNVMTEALRTRRQLAKRVITKLRRATAKVQMGERLP